MRISVIICHHMGNLVLNAIRTVLQSKFVEVELIVATSVQTAAFQKARTLYIQGGPARKRNTAFRFATSDYIAFFDDDVEIEPRCLWEMFKVLRESQMGMVFGKTLNMEHRDIFDEAGSFLTPSGFLWSRGDRIKDTGQFDSAEPILAGKSASCMVRREVFTDVGMFDESYEILGEESDLAWRIWLRGYKVFFVPQSVAYHAFNTRFKPANFYSEERVYFNGCRNYLAMLTTNIGDTKNLVKIVIFQLTAWSLAAIGMFLRGRITAGLLILRGIYHYFATFEQHLKKRKKNQADRRISEDKLMSIILRNPPLSYYLKRFFRYCHSGLHG